LSQNWVVSKIFLMKNTFCGKLGLDENVQLAERYTRYNGEILPNETKNKVISEGNGFWKIGMSVQREGDNFHWIAWTVENKTHVKNFDCIITPDGNLVNGKVNCFALGWLKMDQDYVDEYLGEIEENGIVWDRKL